MAVSGARSVPAYSAKGDALPDTETLPFQYPVTAQFYADNLCWEVVFDQIDTKKNGSDLFKAKYKAP